MSVNNCDTCKHKPANNEPWPCDCRGWENGVKEWKPNIQIDHNMDGSLQLIIEHSNTDLPYFRRVEDLRELVKLIDLGSKVKRFRKANPDGQLLMSVQYIPDEV